MKVVLAAFCVSAFVIPVIGSATPIIFTDGGILNLSGLSVDVTGNASTGCIHFYPNGGNATTCATTTSTFGITSPTDASAFTAASATIQDIPAADNAMLVNFISTTGPLGTVHFDLLSFVPNGTNNCTASTPSGSLPAACTLPNSPFDFLISQPNNITVQYTTDLCGYTGASGGVNCSNGTLYTGTFHAGFVGSFFDGNGDEETVSLANLIAVESSATDGGITDSVAGTLTPTPAGMVPEPGTYLLLGTGLIALSLLGRRRKRA